MGTVDLLKEVFAVDTWIENIPNSLNWGGNKFVDRSTWSGKRTFHFAIQSLFLYLHKGVTCRCLHRSLFYSKAYYGHCYCNWDESCVSFILISFCYCYILY